MSLNDLMCDFYLTRLYADTHSLPVSLPLFPAFDLHDLLSLAFIKQSA